VNPQKCWTRTWVGLVVICWILNSLWFNHQSPCATRRKLYAGIHKFGGSRVFSYHGQWLKIQGWHICWQESPQRDFSYPPPENTRKRPAWFTWDLNDIRSNHLPVEDKKTPYFHCVRLQMLGFSLKLTNLAPFKKAGRFPDPSFHLPSEVGVPPGISPSHGPTLGECSQSGDGGGEPTIFKAWTRANGSRKNLPLVFEGIKSPTKMEGFFSKILVFFCKDSRH